MTNKTFDSLGLSAKTLEAIRKIKYTVPMPVQAEVIPLVLNGKDIIASAQTGSGKTAAFTIPLLDILSKNEDARCLIVAPTRELAQQIFKVFGELSVASEIKSTLIVGGKFMQDQLKKLKKDPRIIIGTPGRINDHIKRKSLVLDNTKYVVWDEMDRMLALGFIHQIEHIVKHLPQDKQTLMFSATFPQRVLKLAQTYLNDPAKVVIDSLNSVSQNIEQKTLTTEHHLKSTELKKITSQTEGQIIVFTKTQKATESTAKYLKENGIEAFALHGALRQSKRETIVREFREKSFKVLVATDVAARGLDIPKISCVVNYDLPQTPEDYIHRIGRTGRVKESGLAISIITKSDKKHWKEIQDFLSTGDEKALSFSEQKKMDDMIEQERKNSSPFSEFKAKGSPSAERNKLRKSGEGRPRRREERVYTPKQRIDTRPKAMREEKSSANGEEKKVNKFVPQRHKEKNKQEKQWKEKQNHAPRENKADSPKKEYEFTPFKKSFAGKKKEKRRHKLGKEAEQLWQKVIKNKKSKFGFNGKKGFKNKDKKR